MGAPLHLSLLRNAPGTIWLVHCDVYGDRMTAEVGLFEAGLEDDWQLVDGHDGDQPHQLLVQIPPQATAQQVRTKAFRLSLPVRSP